MIKDILEINFPTYATLSTATATLTDMGDKVITAQVQIDGAIIPDFSYDWEVEFQGERYIQPLREPQASKGNESICSTIDLTFYHKGIYDLKRYFFVSTVELEAGTLMADNYIVPLRLNIAEFVDYLNKVLSYYYGSTYKVYLNPDYKYDETDRKDIDINYTKIWDVISKIYEWFNVRWRLRTEDDGVTYIYVGYDAQEVSHIFEYGFEGGLLKFERQVQHADIANVIFGRGSSDNIPYRYFKDKDANNPSFPADPDWIPELANVYFANLRGKTFRDYVKGWKAKHYGGGAMFNPTKEYYRGFNDDVFNPIEYVKDEESVAKYGEIQKGLEHNEEIKPTIQGVTIDGIGRVDQIVDVEPILVDESSENIELASDVQPISENVVTWYDSVPSNDTLNMTIAFPTIDISSRKVAHIVKDVLINIVQHVRCTEEFSKYDAVNNKWHTLSSRTIQKENPLKVDSINVSYFDENTDFTPINDLANIDKGVKLVVVVEAKVSGFFKKQTNIPHPNPNYSAYTGTITPDSTFKIVTSLDAEIDYAIVHGQIIGNYKNGSMRESKSVTIPANGTSQVVFTTEEFTISEDDAPATSVDMPYRITSSLKGGEYDPRPNVVAIDVNTSETVSPINLPAGTYYLQNSIQITNLSNKSQTFDVELLPTYIYYSYDSASWKPTFDIWIKNVWQTSPNVGESDYTYEHRVWDAILGNHLGDDAKVVFSSGWLSGHSDYEFTIVDTPKRDTTKTIDGVSSEWRITLYKSDAEMDATSKWLPSIATHANAGDYFYFTGIELPYQYVLWAEDKLDKYKRDQLRLTAEILPTLVVQLDKVRISQLREGEQGYILDALHTGNIICVKDSRFIKASHESVHIQSITYSWDATTDLCPNVEIVLSNIANKGDSFVKSIETTFKGLSKRVLSLEAKQYSIRKIDKQVPAISSKMLDAINLINTNKETQDAINEELSGAAASASIKVFKQQLAEIEAEFASIEGIVATLIVKPAEWLLYLDAYKVYSAKLKEVLKLKNPDSINVSGFDEARATYIDTRDKLKKAINYHDALASQVALYDREIVNVESQHEAILQEWANLLAKLGVLADSTGTGLADADGVALYVYDSAGEYERYSDSANAYISKLRAMIATLDFNENDEYKQLRKDYYREYSLIKTMISQGRVNRFDSIDVTLGGYNDKISQSQKLSAIAIVTANKTWISGDAGSTIMRTSLLDTLEGVTIEKDAYAAIYLVGVSRPPEYTSYEQAADDFAIKLRAILRTTTGKTWKVTSEFVKLRNAYLDARDALREYELTKQ